MCQNQHIRKTVKHFIVIHGRLLPLHSIPQDLHLRLDYQMLHGNRSIPVSPFFIRHGNSDLKKPVIFQHSPVADVPVRRMHFYDIFPMGNKTIIKPIYHRIRQQGTVCKIPDCLCPVLSPKPCLQNPPTSLFRLHRPLHPLHPVCQKPQKMTHIHVIPGQPVCLTKTDKKPVPVKLVAKLSVTVRTVFPVHQSVRVKTDRLPGLLQIMRQIK